MDTLEKKKIFCIASKDEDNEMYFYFYCQEKTSKNIFVFDLKIGQFKNLNLTLKSENEKLNIQFLGFFKQILDEEKIGC